MSVSRPVARGGLWGSHKFSGGLWRGGLWASQRLGFSPLSLFANGEQGAFYLPEPQNLYQDSAGTTPVTADGDPVGLMLDKSQGLSQGPELSTNGTFTGSASPWLGGAFTYNDNNVIASGPGELYQLVGDSINSGTFYVITFEVVSISTGSIAAYCGERVSSGFSSIGVHTAIIEIGGSNTAIGIRNLSSDAVVDNVSIKELPGNHATQTVAASRRLYKTNGQQGWLLDDLVDDGINAQLPNLGTNATLAYADGSGVTILTGQAVSGSTPLPTVAETYGVIYLDRPLTASETESVTTYLNGLRGA